MEQQRKTYTPEFKLKVVLESLQRDTALEAVCQRFGVSKSMVHRWRQDFQANAVNALLDKRNPKQKAVAQGYQPGESPDELKRIIGDLTVQNEILKKPGCRQTARKRMKMAYTPGQRGSGHKPPYAVVL
jgi:transposase